MTSSPSSSFSGYVIKSMKPSHRTSMTLSNIPTMTESIHQSSNPSIYPTYEASNLPSSQSLVPTGLPSSAPSLLSSSPSSEPTFNLSFAPTYIDISSVYMKLDEAFVRRNLIESELLGLALKSYLISVFDEGNNDYSIGDVTVIMLKNSRSLATQEAVSSVYIQIDFALVRSMPSDKSANSIILEVLRSNLPELTNFLRQDVSTSISNVSILDKLPDFTSAPTIYPTSNKKEMWEYSIDIVEINVQFLGSFMNKMNETSLGIFQLETKDFLTEYAASQYSTQFDIEDVTTIDHDLLIDRYLTTRRRSYHSVVRRREMEETRYNVMFSVTALVKQPVNVADALSSILIENSDPYVNMLQKSIPAVFVLTNNVTIIDSYLDSSMAYPSSTPTTEPSESHEPTIEATFVSASIVAALASAVSLKFLCMIILFDLMILCFK